MNSTISKYALVLLVAIVGINMATDFDCWEEGTAMMGRQFFTKMRGIK